MSDLYFLLIVIAKLKMFLTNFGWTTFTLIAIFNVILLICWGILKSNEDESNLEDWVKKHHTKILSIIFLVIFFIVGLAGTLLPSKEEIVTYYVLKQVDKYNSEHKESVFDPSNIIGGTDERVKKISELIDNSFDKINSYLKPKEQLTNSTQTSK